MMMTSITRPVICIRPRRPFERQDKQVHQLLCDILGDEVVLGHRSDGAPVLLSHPDLVLSISHCLSAIAVALAPKGTEIGVDVEDKQVQAERLLNRYSSEDERTLLSKHNVAPILLWSGKETIYKAYGQMVKHFSHDIRLTAIDTTEQTMTFAIPSTEGEAMESVTVQWRSNESKNDKFTPDYKESLVLTYHFSLDAEGAQVISLTVPYL